MAAFSLGQDFYFAYGSNMDSARMNQRGLHVQSAQAGQLEGFALRFNKSSKHHTGIGHANIVFAAKQQVEGVLYELETNEEILKMDPFENAPINYSRDLVRVKVSGGMTQWAWTYFANPAVLQDGLLPSREYLDHLLAGESYLSKAYYEQLARTLD